MPTTRGLHTHRAAELDPTDSVDRSASHVAVGDDGSAKSLSDSTLGNELGRLSIAESEQNGTELRVRGFIDSSQFNGETIREIAAAGAENGGRIFALEALSSADEINKDDTTTVTIDITIDALDASEV